jgi:hypothetical protein
MAFRLCGLCYFKEVPFDLLTEEPEASVLAARRTAQHVRLSSRDDAYERLYILTLLSSLGPLHLMLADAPWPYGFGATLANRVAGPHCWGPAL